jgi:hypothetical protein
MKISIAICKLKKFVITVTQQTKSWNPAQSPLENPIIEDLGFILELDILNRWSKNGKSAKYARNQLLTNG